MIVVAITSLGPLEFFVLGLVGTCNINLYPFEGCLQLSLTGPYKARTADMGEAVGHYEQPAPDRAGLQVCNGVAIVVGVGRSCTR